MLIALLILVGLNNLLTLLILLIARQSEEDDTEIAAIGFRYIRPRQEPEEDEDGC